MHFRYNPVWVPSHLHRTALGCFTFNPTQFYVVSQMQSWHRAANATRAMCRKCNHGNVPQMQPWHRASNAINGQDCARLSIMAITGKPGARRGGVARCGARRGGVARCGARRGGVARCGARRGGVTRCGARRGGVTRCGARRGGVARCGARRGGALFPNHQHTSRAKENATKFQKYLLRTQ